MVHNACFNCMYNSNRKEEGGRKREIEKEERGEGREEEGN